MQGWLNCRASWLPWIGKPPSTSWSTSSGMSKAQAEEVVQSTIGMVEPLKAKAQEVKEQSVDVANATIKNLASAAWWMFLLAIFSLLASLGGGAFGVSDHAMLEVEGLAASKKTYVGA